MLTESYLSPVNYRDSAGEWQPILNQLVREKTGWRNEANSLLLNLPTTLSAPVSLSVGSSSVSFALLGAGGTAAVSGDTARYANALPMADAVYESTGSGVDERITLKSSAAPRVLKFALSTGANLQLRRMAGGALGLFDAQGGLVFYIPQSVAYPAAGTATHSRPLPLSVTGSGSSWQLSLNLDEPWLRRELSAGPVIVDPSIVYGHHASGAGGGGPERTCTLKEASPTKSFCSIEENLSVSNETGAVEHALIFPSASHPGNGILLRGMLVLNFAHSATKNRVNLGVYRVTQSSTAGATWNTYDGTHAWKTLGGDYVEGGDTLIVNGAGGEEAQGPEIDLDITQMMQEWENGPESKAAQGYAGDGMMLALAPGSGKNTIEFHNGAHKSGVPIYIEEWVGGGAGAKPQSTMLPVPVTDRMSMAVNAASGNLLVQSNDLSVKGRGLAFSASRVYNSENAYDFQNEFGAWQDSNQPGLRKESNGNGEGGSRNLLLFRDGTGAWYQFFWNASTSEYITPPGLKATLCASYSKECPVSASYRLTFNESQTHIDFNSYGAPVDVEDRYGNKLASNGENYPPTKWTDTEGRSFTFIKKDSEGTETEERARTNAYTSLTDVSGERTVHYGYETVEGLPVLTSFTDAAGNITHYEYKGSNLVKVTTPRGEVIKITYHSEGNAVASIIHTTNAEHTTGPTWTYTYYAEGKAPSPCTATQKATVVQDPDGTAGETGHKTTYCANAWDQVEKTIDANGNETATSYDAFGNVSATTAPARETGDSRGVTSFVYGTNGQNLLCEVQGTTSGVTECPTGALEKGYSTSQAFEDTNLAFQPTTMTSPRLQATNLCYYGGTHACTGKGKEGEIGGGGALRRETQPEEKEKKPTTIYSYEKDGNMSSSTDFDEHTTRYEYDASGNLKTVIPPVGSGLGKQTITVDGDSRPHIIVQCLTESSCTSSDTTTLTYDPLDRITEAVYTGPGATKTIKYTYNADGGLEKLVDPTGTTTYTLDPLGRVTEEALPGGVSNAYSYDEASNLLSLTDAGGTTHFFYNGLNELESMYEPGGSCTGTPAKCTQFAYDNDGSLTKTTYPSGASMRYKLDSTTGRVLVAEADGTKGETLLSHTYSYYTSINDSPLIFKDTFSGPGGVTAESDYTYDALDRLLGALNKSATASYKSCYQYRYDAVGNITRQESTPTSETCTANEIFGNYNAGNELECRMKTAEACSKSNTTEISGYKYDGAGNQTAITGYNDPASTSFAFNNLSQLEGLTPPGKAEEKLKYLGSGQGKLTGLGTTTLQNSALGITKQTIEGNASYYARTPGGTLIDERLPGGTSYNPVYDAQGDVIGLLNSSGALVQSIRYGPYGENTNTSGTLAYSTTNDPFLFQGGYHIAGGNAGVGNVPNGLYRFGERYYDPTAGRWTQSDPSSNAPEFVFAGDNPVNEDDHTGLCAVAIAATRATTPEGRFAEHQCDEKRETESQSRQEAIGNFTGRILAETGIKGETHYELEYRPAPPFFLASNSTPFGAAMWCSIVLTRKNRGYEINHGPHFRSYPTIPDA